MLGTGLLCTRPAVKGFALRAKWKACCKRVCARSCFPGHLAGPWQIASKEWKPGEMPKSIFWSLNPKHFKHLRVQFRFRGFSLSFVSTGFGGSVTAGPRG